MLCCWWCQTPAESNGRFYSSGSKASAGAGGVHPASWASQRGGGRACGRLKSDVKLTIGGDNRLGGNAVAFEEMREFCFACLECEQQIRVANEDGRGRVLSRRRELVDSAA